VHVTTLDYWWVCTPSVTEMPRQSDTFYAGCRY